MTTQEKFDILNAYYGVVEHNKGYLASTDYQTIREAEGGEKMAPATKANRAQARETINVYQQWIDEIENTEVEEPEMRMEEIPAEEN